MVRRELRYYEESVIETAQPQPRPYPFTIIVHVRMREAPIKSRRRYCAKNNSPSAMADRVPLDASVSPPNASSSSDADASTGDAATLGVVEYAKSFHLRFAGNSTVRKQRPRIRRTREDADGSSTDEDEEDDVLPEAGLQNGTAGENDELDSQERRLKLSQRESTFICMRLHCILVNMIAIPRTYIG